MNNRKLAVLAVVAIAMILWAVMQGRQSPTAVRDLGGPTYLLQGLDMDSIGSMVVGDSNETVTLVRQDNTFVVTDKENYPADVTKVNELVTNCYDVKTSEKYTSNKENHEDLKVTEKTAENIVRFSRTDGTLLTGILIGKALENGQGHYIRLTTGDDVFIASRVPWIPKEAINYIDQELVSSKEEEVASVTVTGPDGSYTITRSEDGEDFILNPLPAGKNLKQSVARSVFNAITSVRFDDVRQGPDANLSFDRAFVGSLKNTIVYTHRIAQDNGKTFMTCTAEYTDPNKVTIDPSKVDSEEQRKQKEEKLLAEAKALKFAERHKGWIYEIPQWKANYLTKKVDDLLEDKPKEDKPAGHEAADDPNLNEDANQ